MLALAAAWRAHTGDRRPARRAWWAVALGAAGAVVQLHVLGVVFLIAIARARPARAAARPRGVALGLARRAGAIVALLFLPLLVHELQTSFLETRRVLDYLAAATGRRPAARSSALAFTLLRVVGWPIVGLVTDVPTAAALLLAVVVGLVGLAACCGARRSSDGSAWLVGHPRLEHGRARVRGAVAAAVVAGLPNDHYHAFLDPVVVILFGVPIAALFERASPPGARRCATSPADPIARRGLVVGAAGFVAARASCSASRPSARPGSRRRLGRGAARRASAIVDGLHGPPDRHRRACPSFKSARRRSPSRSSRPTGGCRPGSASTTTGIVIVCDRLFESQIGAACGGPAEDRFMFGEGARSPDPDTGITPSTARSSTASTPRRAPSISVYRAGRDRRRDRDPAPRIDG